MRRALFCLLTVVVASATVSSLTVLAQDPPKEDVKKEPAKKEKLTRRELQLKVVKLIRQLDADKLEDRDAAELQLRELGADILDLLPPRDARMPGEVRKRLERVANAIESTASNISGEPSQVTLAGDMRLDDALSEMQLATGNKTEGASAVIVKTDFKDMLYMEALDSILDQAQMNINIYGGKPGVLSLVERPDGESGRGEHAAYAGAFRLEPLRVQSVRNLRNPEVQGCRVAIRVEWEPRLRPISLSQPMANITAMDDLGNALAPEGQGNRGSEVSPGVSGIELELPLSLTAKRRRSRRSKDR